MAQSVGITIKRTTIAVTTAQHHRKLAETLAQVHTKATATEYIVSRRRAYVHDDDRLVGTWDKAGEVHGGSFP
jgi:hypothetical protein